MKRIRNLISRLKPRPGQNKKGASLALVVMIGAALVIWVGGIIPMMMGTGDISYKTQASYLSYLQDRSAIEFCKSQLEYIVRSEMPSTFAVTVDANGIFTAIPKRDFMLSVQGEYTSLVDTTQGTDDHGDVPWSDDRGASVVAICSVTINAEDSTYSIFVSTYDNGELSMRYRVTFTPSGSLKIHPEAYNNGEALPLSDFVLVDGQLGSNKVWDSSITMSNAEKLSFNEHLLGVKANPDPGYADAGQYPAIFKTTALPTKENVEIMDPIDPGFFSTDELWLLPKHSDKDEGGLYYVNKGPGEGVRIYLQTKNGAVEITDRCTVYFNGRVSRDKTFPTNPGYYSVTVDFQGTDYSSKDNVNKYDPAQTNVLPTSGLTLKAYNNTKTVDEQELEETAVVQNIVKREETYYDRNGREQKKNVYDVTLALKDAEGNPSVAKDILYRCSSSDNSIIKDWQSSNVFTGLDANKNYYFYIYRPGTYNVEKQEYASDSVVKFAGCIIYSPGGLNYSTNLSRNTNYLILSSNGQQAMNGSGDAVSLSLQHQEDFLIMEGQISNDLVWTANQHGTTNNRSWSFKNAATQQYIGASASYDRRNGWADIKFTYGQSNGDDEFRWKVEESATRVRQNYVIDGGRYDDDHETNLYWDLVGSEWELTRDSNKDVRFLPAPSVSVTLPVSPGNGYSLADDSMAYGNAIGAFLNSNLRYNGNGTNVTVSKVYANSELVVDSANADLTGKLNAGAYEVIAILSNGQSVHLGNVTVSKANLTNLAINAPVRHSGQDADDHCYDISGTWDENAGVRYFGFEIGGTEYWFSTAEDATTFRLKYNAEDPYYFAVRESGNNNYSAKTVWYGSDSGKREDATGIDHTAGNFVLGPEDHLDFVYTIDGEGNPTWYQLPFGLDEDRVKLVYLYDRKTRSSPLSSWANQNDVWRTVYNEPYEDYGWLLVSYKNEEMNPKTGPGTIGIIIDFKESDYTTKSKDIVNSNRVIVIDPAGARGNDSMLKGESLYFMGRNNSIDTRGNTIWLNADLLVLYKDITGGGVVRLAPYTEGKTHALLYVGNDFVRNGSTVFHKGMFYLVPSIDTDDTIGVNLMNVTADRAKTWLVGYSEEEDASKTLQELKDENLAETKKLLRNNTYPEIIMDVALASAEQLSRIVSSETIGWTKKGVLSGSSSETNPAFVVTTFVESMSGQTSYKANRVLLAARSEGADTLTVPYNLTFTCRYLSLDVDNLVQGARNVKFTLKNLGQDSGFIQLLGSWLGLTNYSSKSLQMDYERNMYICRYPNDGTNNIPAKKQICRYEDGVDLFTQSTDTKELITVYTTSEIEDLFTKSIISSLSSSVKTVDRYVSIEPVGSNKSIDLQALLNAELDIYANYVYFSSNVTNISVKSWLNADIRVNSQESGYTTQEYLGIFRRYSGDSYSGTILYFGADTTLNGNRNQVIKQGFYWVNATTNGTSLSKLVGITNANEVAGQIEYLTPEELSAMSVYIRPDGSVNNSYVDTGLADNTSTGLGGFSGGSVG